MHIPWLLANLVPSVLGMLKVHIFTNVHQHLPGPRHHLLLPGCQHWHLGGAPVLPLPPGPSLRSPEVSTVTHGMCSADHTPLQLLISLIKKIQTLTCDLQGPPWSGPAAPQLPSQPPPWAA